jgi:hypothetical protein
LKDFCKNVVPFKKAKLLEKLYHQLEIVLGDLQVVVIIFIYFLFNFILLFFQKGDFGSDVTNPIFQYWCVMSECENLFSHIYYTKKFFKCWKEQNKFSSYVMKCEGLLTKFKVILKTLSSSYDCSVIDDQGTLDPLEFRFYETLEIMCPNLQGLQGFF